MSVYIHIYIYIIVLVVAPYGDVAALFQVSIDVVMDLHVNFFQAKNLHLYHPNPLRTYHLRIQLNT